MGVFKRVREEEGKRERESEHRRAVERAIARAFASVAKRLVLAKNVEGHKRS